MSGQLMWEGRVDGELCYRCPVSLRAREDALVETGHAYRLKRWYMAVTQCGA